VIDRCFHRVSRYNSVNSKPKSARLVLTLSIIAGLIIVGLALTHDHTPLPAAPVILFKTPYTMPAQKVGLLDRVMPLGPSWRWLWNLRYTIFGKTRAIDLNILIVDVKGLDLSAIDSLAKSDLATADGLRVSRIKEADFKKVQLLINKPEQILSSPRATTGNQSQCSIYSGSSIVIDGTTQQFGVSADLLPVIRKDTIDLTAILHCSEPTTNLAAAISIRTNLDIAGRFQLSQDAPGVFILTAPPRAADEKRLALLLTSKVLRPKK